MRRLGSLQLRSEIDCRLKRWMPKWSRRAKRSLRKELGELMALCSLNHSLSLWARSKRRMVGKAARMSRKKESWEVKTGKKKIPTKKRKTLTKKIRILMKSKKTLMKRAKRRAMRSRPQQPRLKKRKLKHQVAPELMVILKLEKRGKMSKMSLGRRVKRNKRRAQLVVSPLRILKKSCFTLLKE